LIKTVKMFQQKAVAECPHYDYAGYSSCALAENHCVYDDLCCFCCKEVRDCPQPCTHLELQGKTLGEALGRRSFLTLRSCGKSWRVGSPWTARDEIDIKVMSIASPLREEGRWFSDIFVKRFENQEEISRYFDRLASVVCAKCANWKQDGSGKPICRASRIEQCHSAAMLERIERLRVRTFNTL
jgi:hypothetical protein